MNVLLFSLTSERELITPPLNGLILPGVTRMSLLELAREWNEFTVTERQINMAEIVEAYNEHRVRIYWLAIACPVTWWAAFQSEPDEDSWIASTLGNEAYLCLGLKIWVPV